MGIVSGLKLKLLGAFVLDYALRPEIAYTVAALATLKLIERDNPA